MGGFDNESVLAWAAETLAQRVKAIPGAIRHDLTKGSGPAIAREALNDVRGTIHNIFFNQGESHSEPGTPMSPLQSEVAEQRKAADGMEAEQAKQPASAAMKAKGRDAGNVHGSGETPTSRLPSPSEIAAETKPYQPPPADRENGQENGNGR